MSGNLSDTRGNALGFGIFRCILRFGGIGTACFFVQPVSLCYVLFDREARKRILPYVRHRFPEAGPLKRLYHIWRIYIRFGEALVRQYAASAGMLRFFWEGREIPGELDHLPDGYVILFSHFGPWMATAECIDEMTKPHFFLVRPDQNRNIGKLGGLRNGSFHSLIHMISVEDGWGGLPEAASALGSGGVVCLMGDRSYESSPVRIPFLGEEASFPTAGFLLAARMHVPVLCIFSEQCGLSAPIHIRFMPLIRPEIRGRDRSSLLPYVRTYVQMLEDLCRRDPYDCFLFDDIWSHDNA